MAPVPTHITDIRRAGYSPSSHTGKPFLFYTYFRLLLSIERGSVFARGYVEIEDQIFPEAYNQRCHLPRKYSLTYTYYIYVDRTSALLRDVKLSQSSGGIGLLALLLQDYR